MKPLTVSDLHGYLIDERSSGSLTEIPATLYESAVAVINDMKKRLISLNDPLEEGMMSIAKERESLREYLRDLYAERTRKIIELAQAKANGEEIDRNELRLMVTAERSLYQVVLESCEACRKNLLEGAPTIEITAYGYESPEVPETATASPAISEKEPVFECASSEDVHSVTTDSAEQAPELHRMIAVQSNIEPFEDANGRVYTLSPGDIVSLPKMMADVLCKTNQATEIHSRK